MESAWGVADTDGILLFLGVVRRQAELVQWQIASRLELGAGLEQGADLVCLRLSCAESCADIKINEASGTSVELPHVGCGYKFASISADRLPLHCAHDASGRQKPCSMPSGPALPVATVRSLRLLRHNTSCRKPK